MVTKTGLSNSAFANETERAVAVMEAARAARHEGVKRLADLLNELHKAGYTETQAKEAVSILAKHMASA